MFSSFSSSLQSSSSWSLSSLWPLLFFLLFELHAQLDMPLLHFLPLLFKHLSVVLGDVGVNRGGHNDTEEKQKTSLFCLCIVDLGTIMEFFG